MFFLYLRERFPLFPAGLFSLLFTGATITYGRQAPAPFETYLIAALTLFLFFLRLRLWDEKKDFAYDTAHHQDRPVQRGLIPLAFLFRISLVILAIELLLQLAHPPFVWLFFSVIVGYSWLMYKEFYASTFLRQSMLLYSLSHQMIFFLYILYFVSIGRQTLFVPTTLEDWAVVTALFLLPYIYEVGRKSRHRLSTDGTPTDDTYVHQWGENRTFFFLTFLFLIEIFTLMYLRGNDIYLWLYILALAACILGFLLNKKRILHWAPLWSMALGIYGLVLLDLALL